MPKEVLIPAGIKCIRVRMNQANWHWIGRRSPVFAAARRPTCLQPRTPLLERAGGCVDRCASATYEWMSLAYFFPTDVHLFPASLTHKHTGKIGRRSADSATWKSLEEAKVGTSSIEFWQVIWGNRWIFSYIWQPSGHFAVAPSSCHCQVPVWQSEY